MSVYIAGHSLGAARASLYAFSRIKRGLPVAGVFLFGCPRPGDRAIRDTLAAIPIRSIKNGNDPITDVPLDIELLGEDYTEPRDFEAVNAPWNDSLPDWGPFNAHHIELYLDGCKTLPNNGTLLTVAQAVYDLYNLLGKWDWDHPEDGRYWGMRRVGSDQILVSRGSTTPYDWVENFRVIQCAIMGARVSDGFWDGVGPIESLLDATLEG